MYVCMCTGLRDKRYELNNNDIPFIYIHQLNVHRQQNKIKIQTILQPLLNSKIFHYMYYYIV